MDISLDALGGLRPAWAAEMKPMMKPIGLGLAALCLLATTAPLAAADVTVYRIDMNGDGDCRDPGETYVVEAPVTWPPRPQPCIVFAD